ncbi:MAG: FAD-dependent oxidoreductase [Thiohalocapsa sp.]|jgi:protoporphyrinogen oxidase|uniref:FAD-dependent oxidoreductase n=1 Tax=Thiohalocapsa sp. TaxID=2497641 RepID=UPI0025CB947F|nr:FAD-dependent oxidoreductase [Thiohalocapsa sp.]MCG6941960.1 FAD-dependent oxidoreductase [Thiohalocapsa sp.]
MDSTATDAEHIAILGAGASGLALGWLLSQAGKRVTLFEAAPHIGGLARTFDWHGIPCDIAPHRLHTGDMEVLDAVRSLVPLREHERRSRILMRGRQIRDPINPIELVLRFPPRTGFALVWGFLNRPKLPETSFEGLALNRYGRGLYDFFFAPYTKKMFGVSPAEISVTWGREKLRASGLLDTLKRQSKTFFHSFWYPAQGGYQAILDAMLARVRGEVLLNAPVTGLETADGRITAVRYRRDGTEQRFACDRVFSTIPATGLGRMLGEEIPLRFKRIQLVYLDIARPEVMPYQWVYFGDGDVVINRMAEFQHFHPDLPPRDHSVLCAEVTMDTDRPVADVLEALERYGLVSREEVRDTLVLTEDCGYPVYDKGFEAAREQAQALFGRFDNLHCVGRNAEFRHIETDEDIASAAACLRRIYGDASVVLRP